MPVEELLVMGTARNRMRVKKRFLENLRLLCPNCHSQTPNFAGRRSGQ